MAQDNKKVAHRFIMEAFMANKPAAWQDTVAEDVIDHNPMPDQKPGRAGVQQSADVYRSGFPDISTTIDQQVAEGDFVVNRGVASGTNTGEMMGIPPTGKKASVPWMDMYRIKGGQIVEFWHVEDIAGMMQQLGLAP